MRCCSLVRSEALVLNIIHHYSGADQLSTTGFKLHCGSHMTRTRPLLLFYNTTPAPSN